LPLLPLAVSSDEKFLEPSTEVLQRRVAFDKHGNATGRSLRSCVHFQSTPATSLCRVQKKRTIREENLVGCLLLVVFLAFPRIALALLFLFSTYLQRAYHGLILPLLGFLFLPLTTLVYAWMANTRQPIAGINLLILVVTIVIDLGGFGGGEYHRRRRRQD
jgi:hypothetical protein